MKITNMRVNHLTNPLGYDLEDLCLSWVATDTNAKKQQAARVVIMEEEFGKGAAVVYDSGKREDISSIAFNPEVSLKPYTKYSWRVIVWGDDGEFAASDAAYFETSKIGEAWEAKWITPSFDKNKSPYMRKTFNIDGEIIAARAYVCGHGLYELEVNGIKAGNEYLMPGYHAYDAFNLYQTFDITDSLTKGQNAVGAIIGQGWYKSRVLFAGDGGDTYGDKHELICEIKVWLKDGSVMCVNTDETWKCAESPVLDNGIYDGETYDARKAIRGWSTVECDDSSWTAAVVSDKDYAKLTARINPPIVAKETFKPIELIHTKKDEYVLDAGQNTTGWLEFIVDEPEGTKISLYYSEVMQNGVFYNENLRSAKAEYHYISDGKKRTVRPYFTFFGFRYVKIEGLSRINLENFTVCNIMSDIDFIGNITTSNSDVNKLFKNAMWGQRDNFLDIPTDCPQRDERLGWTGDAAVFSSTASQNMYTPAFFHHYMKNVYAEQCMNGGAPPMVAPFPKPKEAHPMMDANKNRGITVWSDAATIVPWTVYEMYGDKSLLKKHYCAMKDWVDWIVAEDKKTGDKGLWQTGFHFGDWLALDNPENIGAPMPPQPEGEQKPEDDDGSKEIANVFGLTDVHFISSAYYYYSTTLLANAAEALGYCEDKEKYTAQAEKIKNSFLKEYFNDNGTFKTRETQTACVICLFMGLYPQGKKEFLVNRLKRRIMRSQMHLDTGFVGTPLLCRVLSDFGVNSFAYTLLLNSDMPSWLYEVKMGATTIWERWNSILPDGSISSTGMNSLNHYSYGSIVDWMYRNMCGINPAQPGYKKAVIKPTPDARINWAKADIMTAAGLYRSGWKHTSDGVVYSVTVPFDCEAEFIKPDGEKVTLTAGNYELK